MKGAVELSQDLYRRINFSGCLGSSDQSLYTHDATQPLELHCSNSIERRIDMTVFLTLLGAMAISAMVGTVVVTARDGYRQVPTRSN